jgi:hypothetical protein
MIWELPANPNPTRMVATSKHPTAFLLIVNFEHCSVRSVYTNKVQAKVAYEAQIHNGARSYEIRPLYECKEEPVETK